MLTARFPSCVRSLNRTFGEVGSGAGSSSGSSRVPGLGGCGDAIDFSRCLLFSVGGGVNVWLEWAASEGVGYMVVGCARVLGELRCPI